MMKRPESKIWLTAAKIWPIAVLITSLVVLPHQILAQDICEETHSAFEEQPAQLLSALLMNECLAGERDDDSLMVQLRESRRLHMQQAREDGHGEVRVALASILGTLMEADRQLQDAVASRLGSDTTSARTMPARSDTEMAGGQAEGRPEPEAETAEGHPEPETETAEGRPESEMSAGEALRNAVNSYRQHIRLLFESSEPDFIREVMSAPDGLFTSASWNPGTQAEELLKIHLTPNEGYPSISIEEQVIAPACGKLQEETEVSVANETCGEAVANAKLMLRVAKVISESNSELAANHVQDVSEGAEALLAQWNAYLTQTRTQTPLELLINSRRWRRSTADTEPGFRHPPVSQIILLKPGVGLNYVDSEGPADQLEPALYMEIIGYNRWGGYKPAGNTNMALGASFITAYSKRFDSPNWGYGAMMHINHTFSLAYIRYGSDSGVMVSADFMKLLSWTRSRMKEQFR